MHRAVRRGLALRTSYGNVLTGNVIVSNVASISGGGVLINEGKATFAGNLVAKNAAPTGGGVNLEWGTGVFSQDVISGNVANVGGGLYTWRSTASLVNEAVLLNQGATGGSGVYAGASTARLTHVTLAGNYGGIGDGLTLTSDDVRSGVLAITNTIVASQSVGIVVDAGSVTANGILWYLTPVTTTGTGEGDTVTNQYVGDPLFGPDGYHLGAGSAAINRGCECRRSL